MTNIIFNLHLIRNLFQLFLLFSGIKPALFWEGDGHHTVLLAVQDTRSTLSFFFDIYVIFFDYLFHLGSFLLLFSVSLWKIAISNSCKAGILSGHSVHCLISKVPLVI